MYPRVPGETVRRLDPFDGWIHLLIISGSAVNQSARHRRGGGGREGGGKEISFGKRYGSRSPFSSTERDLIGSRESRAHMTNEYSICLFCSVPGTRTVRQLLPPVHQLPQGQDADRPRDRRSGELEATRAG